jgi:hypothetical protein
VLTDEKDKEGDSYRRQSDQLLEEARRLAQLPARERKEALAVHVADDTRLSQTTRTYARELVDTLEKLVKELRKKK